MIDILTAALAETLCRADDTMFHHERTDDFPCSFCKAFAAEQAKALAEQIAAAEQRGREDERERVAVAIEARRGTLHNAGSWEDVTIAARIARAGGAR